MHKDTPAPIAVPAVTAVLAQPAPLLETRWAGCEEDVRDAQRLRYRVFAEEMGARLAPPEGTAGGLDADRFDPFCDRSIKINKLPRPFIFVPHKVPHLAREASSEIAG